MHGLRSHRASPSELGGRHRAIALAGVIILGLMGVVLLKHDVISRLMSGTPGWVKVLGIVPLVLGLHPLAAALHPVLILVATFAATILGLRKRRA